MNILRILYFGLYHHGEDLMNRADSSDVPGFALPLSGLARGLPLSEAGGGSHQPGAPERVRTRPAAPALPPHRRTLQLPQAGPHGALHEVQGPAGEQA